MSVPATPPREVEPSEPAWHAISAADALRALDASPEGLGDEEAARRRERFGPNELPEEKPPSLARVVLRQFKSPLIYVLLVAAGVSVAIGEPGDAFFIALVLLLNAAIGTVQEWQAETSAQALQKMMRIVARVRRGGRVRAVDAGELVPGDVVSLESGDAVPADLRLLRSLGLRADESLLTGESLPAAKHADRTVDVEATVGDRASMVFAGTAVVEGRADAVVCRTGSRTELGRISESLGERHAEKPPLVLRLERFSAALALVVLVAVVVLAVIQLAQGAALVDVFFLAVALAVSVIPEGLPVAITVALSIASRRMSARNVIVRKLPAVEGLGACTLIASDKTGTLTANRLTATRLRLPDGTDLEVGGGAFDSAGEVLCAGRAAEAGERAGAVALARAAALCSEGLFRVAEDGTPEHAGDAVDVAFLVLAAKLGISREALADECPQVRVVPYESERRYAATFDLCPGGLRAHVKGAADVVVPMCGGIDAERVLGLQDRLAADGYRVLAVAAGPLPEGAEPGEGALRGLELLGLVGLIDPIRPEVPDAIRRCRSAGVDVRMITGDHPATGLAIARQIHLAREGDPAPTGAELKALADDPDALTARVGGAPVFARIEPTQKTLIVKAFQRAGHFVAVTGDGVNDAPALQAAHIGVAMGRSGTDVARRAADLILTDDNFASIVNGVEEGRVAYDNVRKVTWLLVATGAAELVLFFLAQFTGTPLPLGAVQLLWLNLVTNGVQDVALAFEKGEPGVLERRPRPPEQRIFDRRMIEQTLIPGVYMGAVGFGVFWWLHVARGMDEFAARNCLLLLMVLFENAHAFNARSERRPAMRVPFRNNPILVVGVVAAQAIHIAAMYVPGLNDVLQIRPVGLVDWIALLGIAVTVVLLTDAYKWLRNPSLEALERGRRVEAARSRRRATGTPG